MSDTRTFLGEEVEATETKSPEEMASSRKANDAVVSEVKNLKRQYGDIRQERENKWLEAWGQYFGTPEAQQYLRSRAFHTVGEVQTDWRHRIPTGKAFEMVESVTSFLMGAFFPNENWFDVEANEPLGFEGQDYRRYLRLIRNFTRKKLQDANFEDYMENFTRQAVTVGTSVLAMPWRLDNGYFPKNEKTEEGVTIEKGESQMTYNGFNFEVIDIFDFFIEPKSDMPNEGNVIRRFEKTRGELVRLVESGIYDKTTVKSVKDLKASYHANRSDSFKDEKSEFEGLQPDLNNPSDLIEVLEFWGDITVDGVEYSNVVVTVAGDELLGLEKNPFWQGKPFVVGTYIPVVNSPYGLGLLDPVLGDLHARMMTRNQRLDITEFSINPMFEAVNDGTLDFSQLYSEPGRVIPVTETGSIQQINSVADVSTSVQEEQLMEQSIEKSTGTGAYIGSGATRNAERVTAQEIEATRAAGGNRLNGIHRHIERTALFLILKKCFRSIQQFVTEDETMPLAREEDPDTIEFINVGPEELNKNLHLKPRGADYIADEEFELKQRIDFINTAAQVQPMAEQLNWTEIAKDLARRFLRDDWEKYINPQQGGQGAAQQLMGGEGQQPPEGAQQPQQQAAQEPQSEVDAIRQAARSFAGPPGEQAVESAMRSGQGQEKMEQLGNALQSDRENK